MASFIVSVGDDEPVAVAPLVRNGGIDRGAFDCDRLVLDEGKKLGTKLVVLLSESVHTKPEAACDEIGVVESETVDSASVKLGDSLAGAAIWPPFKTEILVSCSSR
jgi:hypothetical protein